ncbi:helix-turn-helix domain-containing protein [Undibacterium sp. RuRC25W]|uniref:helix-turn-helix domain-containing protein n=1 Tax=Undibacterium sp. RuRC25W TaxID=3413047 RepID=UPI003BF36044
MCQLNYDPNALVNSVIYMLELKNDFHLSKVLGVSPSTIARIRCFQLLVSASMLVRLHQETGLSIKELRALMGDERKFFERIDLATCTKIVSPPYKKNSTNGSELKESLTPHQIV